MKKYPHIAQVQSPEEMGDIEVWRGGDGESEADGGVEENDWGQGVGGDVLSVLVFIYIVFYFKTKIYNRGSTAPREKTLYLWTFKLLHDNSWWWLQTRDGILAENKFRILDDLFWIHLDRGSILVIFRILGYQFRII